MHGKIKLKVRALSIRHGCNAVMSSHPKSFHLLHRDFLPPLFQAFCNGGGVLCKGFSLNPEANMYVSIFLIFPSFSSHLMPHFLHIWRSISQVLK